MASVRFPIPQGTLDMLVLQILSLGPAHGYAIAQRLQQLSRDAVQPNQGSLYPALHRLEQRGWLRSEWRESETGREAKFYTLTRTGEKQLAVERASLEPAGDGGPADLRRGPDSWATSSASFVRGATGKNRRSSASSDTTWIAGSRT